MSTEDFLNALRRFIARRGTPESITCDNAPTFLLAANILADGSRSQALDNTIHNVMVNHEIQWKHITAYAPWQGGFYERLSKSIKHSLYKAMRNEHHHTLDHLTTVITEVEACLNSRPLTYQSSDHDDLTQIRPIDFLQRDMTISFPYASTTTSIDADYLPPEEVRTLQTRIQAEEALKSSCALTEKFWKIWRNYYVTSLREQHKWNISGKRHSNKGPTTGDVVLVSDPVLPRNEWKMARITETHAGLDGEIRDVELVTAAKRKIRRPVNLLIPLEIEDSKSAETNKENCQLLPKEQKQEQQKYNFRPRKPVQYAEYEITAVTAQPTTRKSPSWFLFHIMWFSQILLTCANTSATLQMGCTNTGVVITSTRKITFEICADTFCKVYHLASSPYLVQFPPYITIHDYEVTVKWDAGRRIATMETTCRGINFCANIDCWLCATVLLNPECWPTGAILMAAILLYGIVAFSYLLLYRGIEKFPASTCLFHISGQF
ncbi:hypothetical protein Y032_0017g3385 [Ancylostoma ceylanicum]|uniref:Integrase catalytic domain-containing protein n=1 Tax=Ancylostoma ceylanicum TaxID=53326 RepID=A0A016V6Z4_9BILA|nr:hypothetical protein Y032_0017g3385 [Ancylostoma ceylanicum]